MLLVVLLCNIFLSEAGRCWRWYATSYICCSCCLELEVAEVTKLDIEEMTAVSDHDVITTTTSYTQYISSYTIIST